MATSFIFFRSYSNEPYYPCSWGQSSKELYLSSSDFCENNSNLNKQIECEQSLFSQSSLSSAGLERANWPRGKLERGGKKRLGHASEESASEEIERSERKPRGSFPLSQFALSSPAELRLD